MEVFALNLKVKEEGMATVEKATASLRAKLTQLNLGSLLAGAGLAALTRSAIQTADEMRLLEGRLKLVTGSAAELTAVQDALRESANRTRSDYGSAVELFARVARSTRDLKIAQADLLRFTELTQMAIKTSGSTSVEASAALIQLSQGLASGTLRGDEFRSVMEQVPGLALQIAAGLGISVGQLREMAMAGQLTADAVIGAVLKMDATIRGDFASAPVTVADAFTVLRNAVGDALNEVNKATGATAGMASVIVGLVPAVEGIAAGLVAVGNALDYAVPLLITFAGLWASMNLPLIVSTVGALANTLVAVAARLNLAALATGAWNAALAVNPIGAAVLAVSALTAGLVAYGTAQQKAAEARDEEVKNSPAYIAALESIRQRREAATATERAAADAARQAAEEAKNRTANLVELADITALTNGEMDELVALQTSLASQLRNGNFAISERIRLLKELQAVEDAIANGETEASQANKRRADEAMARARAGRSATSVGGGIAAGGVMTFGGQASTALEDFAAQGAAEAQRVADQLALDINDSFGNAIGGALVDGLSSGIAAAIGSGRIADAWQAMSQAIIQNISSAMVNVALTAIKFGTLMTKIQTFMTKHPALAVAAAAAMLAFAYNNGGKAKAGGTAVTGGIGGASFTPMMPMGQMAPTQLIFGTTSATTAAGMTPRQAVNVTLIGPNDPTAQRAMQELLRNANQRGTLG